MLKKMLISIIGRGSFLYYWLQDREFYLRKVLFKAHWRKLNPHNETVPGKIFDIRKVSVGKGTYGELKVHCFDNPKEHLTIGNYCSIAGEVDFILGGEHPLTHISTFPFCGKVFPSQDNAYTGSKGPIIVQDDVWIGHRCVILSGVTLGQGCVIGAGSMIRKDVPPYAVYSGGSVVNYRFPPEIVSKLMRIDFGSITPEAMTKFRKYYLIDVDSNNIDRILACFEK